MSDNEFDELYQSGDLIWVDPDGREWAPAHIHASLTEKVERLNEAGHDARLAWRELQDYAKYTDRATMPCGVKQAYMILRELFSPFDRQRLGKLPVDWDALLESE